MITEPENDGTITLSYYDTPCGVYPIKDCPFGFEDCDECEEFMDECEKDGGLYI